jgi:hypothetical protein
MENTNNKIIQTTPASGKECIVLELPEQDIEFLYRLFDLYCDEPEGEFYPDVWISNTVSGAVRELKQGIREKLK